jgi:uncharacterized protein
MRRKMMIRKVRLLTMVVALGALALALVLSGCASFERGFVCPHAELSPGGQPSGIAVTGIGEVTVVPDIAIVSLGVQAQAPTVAEAQAQASVAMDNVLAAVRSGGVADEDIRTTGFTIFQQTRWEPVRQESEVTGYVVTNSVQVTIRQIDDAGNILDAAVAAGGDFIRVHGISFEVDDPAPHLAEARGEAVADARSKAQQLAQLAGVTLGSPTYISETSSAPIIFRSVDMALPGTAPVPTTPIQPGETTVTVSIQLVYAIAS